MSANAETLMRSLVLSHGPEPGEATRAAKPSVERVGGGPPGLLRDPPDQVVVEVGPTAPEEIEGRAHQAPVLEAEGRVVPQRLDGSRHARDARVCARLDEPVADALRRRPGPDRPQLVAAAPVGHEPHVVTGHQPEVVPDPLRDGDLPLARDGRLDHGCFLTFVGKVRKGLRSLLPWVSREAAFPANAPRGACTSRPARSRSWGARRGTPTAAAPGTSPAARPRRRAAPLPPAAPWPPRTP